MKYFYVILVFFIVSCGFVVKNNSVNKELITANIKQDQQGVSKIIEIEDYSHQEGKYGGVQYHSKIRKDSTLHISSRFFGGEYVIDTVKVATGKAYWEKLITILNINNFSKLPLFSIGKNGLSNESMRHRMNLKTKDTLYNRIGVSLRFIRKDFSEVKTMQELIGSD